MEWAISCTGQASMISCHCNHGVASADELEKWTRKNSNILILAISKEILIQHTYNIFILHFTVN